MQSVILAGGLGTRLLPLTSTVPKSLVSVAGRPFIAWQLERLRASGIDDVIVCAGHFGERIAAFLGDGARFGVRARFAFDGPTPLGTAGALRGALPWLDSTFVVTYGDSYLEFDYSSLLRDLDAHPEAEATLAVYENRGAFDTSNVALDGDWVARYAKGACDPGLDHIDYGAMAMRRRVIERLPGHGPFGLDALQAELASAHSLRALRQSQRFYEIGSKSGLAELESHLLRFNSR